MMTHARAAGQFVVRQQLRCGRGGLSALASPTLLFWNFVRTRGRAPALALQSWARAHARRSGARLAGRVGELGGGRGRGLGVGIRAETRRARRVVLAGPDPPRPADAPNRASSSPSHGAAAPLRAVIDAGGFPAFARSTPGTARDEPWPAARLFASGADESVVIPAWSPFSPRFVAPDDERECDARSSSSGPHPRAAAKPRPTFSSPSLIDLRRTSFSIDEAESSNRAVVPSVTPRDDDAAEPRGVVASRAPGTIIPRLVPAARESTHHHPVPALPWSVLERMDRASGRHSLSPDPRGLIDAAHLRAIVHERRTLLEGSGGSRGQPSGQPSGHPSGQPSGQPSGRERPTHSNAPRDQKMLDASIATALERRVGGAWATRAKMRELAFAALASWRFSARRSRGSALRALAFRSSRHDRRLVSRSFVFWRRSRRARDAVERWLRASRRNRLVVAFERWNAVRFCLRPARIVAGSEAITRWRRSYLVPAFAAMMAMKATYIDAPRVSADRFLFKTLGLRTFARWRRKAARFARRRAWDVFVERWRVVRALSVGFNAWATLALVTLRTARENAEKMREDLAFERVVRAFSHWRRRARQISRGAALVDLACAKWDAERTRLAFGAMQAASVLRSARRADADEHAERWRRARAIDRWRRGFIAYERNRLAPAADALARVATKTRKSFAFRDWRSRVFDTNALVNRFRSAVSAKYLASRSIREWRLLCRDLRASRRYAHAKLAPTRRRLLARAALRVFAANAETWVRIRAERLATGLELAALRRMHRAFERWLRVASERVLRRLQTRRAIRHRTHRALRFWRAHHASTAEARERRRRANARAVAIEFAAAWGAWREIVAACGKARRAVDRYSGSMRAGHQGFHGHAGRAGGGGLLVGNTAGNPVANGSRQKKRTFEDLFRGDLSLRFVAPAARARAKAIVAAMERRAIGAEAMRAWGEKAERERKKNVLGMWSLSRGGEEAKNASARRDEEEDDAETAATVAADAETSSRPPGAPPGTTSNGFERTSRRRGSGRGVSARGVSERAPAALAARGGDAERTVAVARRLVRVGAGLRFVAGGVEVRLRCVLPGDEVRPGGVRAAGNRDEPPPRGFGFGFGRARGGDGGA